MSKAGKYYRKWRSLPWDAKFTFVKASVVLVLVHTGLKLLPFSTFKSIFHKLTHQNRFQELSPEKIAQVVWAVDTAANILPFELLCLPRALATKYMLRKVPSLTLEIGIEINPTKAFEAHAWVEKSGNIIIGDWPSTMSYQRLWVWE